MKKIVAIVCLVIVANIVFLGCGNNASDELEALRAEIEQLKSATNPSAISSSGTTQIENTSIAETEMETTIEETTEEPIIDENILYLKNNPISSPKFITWKEQNSKANIFSDILAFIRDLDIKIDYHVKDTHRMFTIDRSIDIVYTDEIPAYPKSICMEKPSTGYLIKHTFCFNGNVSIGESIETIINAYGKPTKIESVDVSGFDCLFYDFDCFDMNIYHTNDMVDKIIIDIKEIPAILQLENYLSIYSIETSKPNTANGVDVDVRFSNDSDKTIKYIYFYLTPYNAVDDAVASEIGDKSTTGVGLVGPMESGEQKYIISSKNVWYSSTIQYALLESVKIIYMDGEEVVLLVE